MKTEETTAEQKKEIVDFVFEWIIDYDGIGGNDHVVALLEDVACLKLYLAKIEKWDREVAQFNVEAEAEDKAEELRKLELARKTIETVIADRRV